MYAIRKENASFSTSSRCARIYTIKLVAWPNEIYCNQYVIPIYLKHMKKKDDVETIEYVDKAQQQQHFNSKIGRKNIERITISRIREFLFRTKNLK